MFKHEEEQIIKYYELGYSCYALAKVMGIDYSTVKQFRRDNNLGHKAPAKSTAENRQLKACEFCGRVFVKKVKHAKFCSDACRRRVWAIEKQMEMQVSEENFGLANLKLPPKRKPTNSSKEPLALCRRKSDEWKKNENGKEH